MIRHGRRAIAVVSVAASTAGAQAPHAPSYLNPAWAPDGRSLAFESDRDGKFAVYTIHVDGSALTKLTSGAFDDVQPQWSPDGKRIVFVSNRDGHDQIYTMAPDGTGQIKLAASERDPYFLPTYSPNGAMILFAGQSATRRDIYYVCVVRSDGTGMRRLTDSTVSSEGPRWSPDGRSVFFLQPTLLTPDSGEPLRAFMRRRNASMRRMTIRPDGSGLTVSAAAAGDDSTANVSPDGHFTAREKTVNGAQGIYLFDTVSGGERLLVPKPTPTSDGHKPPPDFFQGVSLSPDGQRIALTSYKDRNLDIYSFRLDGSDLRRLTSDTASELWESWSPDSRRLLYTRINADHTRDIYEMSADGSGKHVAPNGAGRGGLASWSPDGRFVLFQRMVDSVEQVFVMDADGSHERQVTHTSWSAESPRWSFDGRRIAFESVVANTSDQIYVIDADGSHQLQVTHDTAFSIFANWTPDGRVTFIRKGSLYVVNADGSGERLLRKTVSYAVFSRDGKRMVFLGGEVGAPGGFAAARVYVADADGSNARRIRLPIDP